MKSKSYLFLIITIFFVSCERDDICPEGSPSTPRLLVEFFDIADTDVLKDVPRLTVYPDNENITEPTTEDPSGAILQEPFLLPRVFNTNLNNAGLPFLVGIEGERATLRYFFERDTNLRLNDDTSTTSNIDVVEISYIPEFIYVSRACGFRSVFREVEVEIIEDEDNWLLRTDFPDTIETQISVENEDITHVQLFH